MIKKILTAILLLPTLLYAQINTERVMTIARNALYFEDYVLSIQYFNQVINAKPYLYEPYFFRGLAKINLDDYQGAESDCDAAIQRNPFVVGAYQIRGLARIRQNKFDGAIEDYKTALKYDPENLVLWHNLSLCHIQKEDYESAKEDLGTLLTIAPRYTRAYLMRGEVSLKQNDTIQALHDFDKAIGMDRYDPDGWGARAIVRLQQGKYKEAEADLDHSIHLSAKNAGNYINRALARFHQNNLRGAMSDYDLALDIDPNNFLGHYNRGLLRAQVGDDNRAITDFDFVLGLEPDNMMALFNRGLLLDKTGDLRGAIRDYSKVIDRYPNFWTGLHYRAGCYRRLGMTRQAETDEFRIYKARLYKSLYGKQPRLNKDQMRKRSDEDLDKYNQLVVADEHEVEHEYENDYRGRVQNRRVDMAFMPMYELSYEQHRTEVKPFMAFDSQVEAFNSKVRMSDRLYINCVPAKLDERRSAVYFSRIDSLSSVLAHDSGESRRSSLLRRAVAYSVIQNFESAIEDLSAVILADSTSSMAYWQRAVCRSKMETFEASQGIGTSEIASATVIADFSAAIRYNPRCAYLYYNRGNVYALCKDYVNAIEDYNRALVLDENLAEAYYNRGLVCLKSDRLSEGINDLSKAGELGLYTAYSVIKKYSKK